MRLGDENKCMLCHQTNVKKLYDGHDRAYGVEGDFFLVECQVCCLVWISPRLPMEQISKYYPPDYMCYSTAINDDKNYFRRMDRQFGVEKRVNRVLSKAGRSGKVLDIGCSTGIFLNGMKQRGWECFGIEPSEHASTYAKNYLGLDVFTGFLEESKYPASFFDVITLWDVFEHLPNPKEDLVRIWQILKPGGLLIICTPNSESWERKAFGKYWSGWEVPRHFYIYSQRNLTRLLSEMRFHVESISSFTGRHGVLIISMTFWLKDSRLPVWLQNAILVLMKSIPVRLLTYPYYMIADRLNKSSIMTVFAKKGAE